MEKPVKKFYWAVFFIILLLSAYPIVMGAKIVILYIRHGVIRPDDYANYVIPYSALCASILVMLLLYPLLSKLKRFSALAAAILGSGLFLALELYMENITINSPEAQSTLQWQLFSCIGTPAAMRAFLKYYDNTFKIHYFLISFVILILIASIVYNYKNAVISNNR
ncbi:MAG TPA: hypothetical protein GX505_00890, partial [Clostridiales bacterium]|nr:hypothetical protein [Clostridiales bacterium]